MPGKSFRCKPNAFLPKTSTVHGRTPTGTLNTKTLSWHSRRCDWSLGYFAVRDRTCLGQGSSGDEIEGLQFALQLQFPCQPETRHAASGHAGRTGWLPRACPARPTSRQLAANSSIDEALAGPDSAIFGVFDDVITAGARCKAAQRVPRSRSPDVSVVGFFHRPLGSRNQRY